MIGTRMHHTYFSPLQISHTCNTPGNMLAVAYFFHGVGGQLSNEMMGGQLMEEFVAPAVLGPRKWPHAVCPGSALSLAVRRVRQVGRLPRGKRKTTEQKQ